MAWTDGIDRATGFLVTAVNWNDLLGASGSLMQLKSHAHGGTTGEGSQSIGALVLADFTDAVAPAAPGAGKTRLYTTSSRPRFRAGAAGADLEILTEDMFDAKGDLLVASAADQWAKVPVGATTGHALKVDPAQAAGVAWGQVASAHADLTGVSADQHHSRTEAKVSAGTASEESVTWTTAFAAAPVVVTAPVAIANAGHYSFVVSRSTTGASVQSQTHDASQASDVKLVIAQAAT